MKLLQKIKLNYIKGLPIALFTTTSISTYISIKNEMNRRIRLPYEHHIKNVAISSCIGLFTGALYPITFPMYFLIFIYK
jgi:hypothetical protein